MNILVTAGNTLVPIDQVRCLTNIFTGRTGAALALEACRRTHAVTLLTSNPDVVDRTLAHPGPLEILSYRTFEDLEKRMEELIRAGRFDAVIHCAAVSDYRAAGIFSPAPGTRFDAETARWKAAGPPAMVDRSAAKVKSDEPELWLRLVRAPKLVDRVRGDWGFRGILVKFKLEAGVTDPVLLDIAERSRIYSGADFMVANTLEGAQEWAFIGPLQETYQRVNRDELPQRLLAAIEVGRIVNPSASTRPD